MEENKTAVEEKDGWILSPDDWYEAVVTYSGHNYVIAALDNNEMVFVHIKTVIQRSGHRCAAVGQKLSLQMAYNEVPSRARYIALKTVIANPQKHPTEADGIVEKAHLQDSFFVRLTDCDCSIFAENNEGLSIEVGDKVKVGEGRARSKGRYAFTILSKITGEDV